jgi:hypothetical protein
MKKFFAKFRISSAMDSGAGVPEKLRRGANRSSDVGDFLERAEMVDRALKREKLPESMPGGLHGSIMRAVAQSRSSEAEPRILMPRWMPAMGVAVMLVFVLLWGLRLNQQSSQRAAGVETLAAATEALQISKDFAQTIPAKVVAPVSGELQKINQDVDATAKFLVASIPEPLRSPMPGE